MKTKILFYVSCCMLLYFRGRSNVCFRTLKRERNKPLSFMGQAFLPAPTVVLAMLQDSINAVYPESVEVINSARGAMWSTWGVQNLDERVLSKKPDMILMEFGMNDAYLPYKTSKEVCRLNVEYMIDRIQEALSAMRDCLAGDEHAYPGAFGKRPHIDAYYDVYLRLLGRGN